MSRERIPIAGRHLADTIEPDMSAKVRTPFTGRFVQI
jgi:hypothetical protein